MHTDPEFFIITTTRRRVNKELNGGYTENRTTSLIGIPIHEYKVYLEWTAYMNGLTDFDANNWDHKKYVIDHIVPISWFNAFDPNQLRECFFFMNTQIMKAGINGSKNNHYWDKPQI